MPNLDFLAYVLPIVVLVILSANSIRILREYERGVVFTARAASGR